jgi:DNA-binding PadR family transcriptional regulator
MDTSQNDLLSRTAFGILLALSLKPRHGYELMQQIEHDTDGHVKLGPGALYGTVKQLRGDSLIEEMPFEIKERRRYYRLTKKGWNRLSAEMKYYEQTVRLARERRVMDSNIGAALKWMI